VKWAARQDFVAKA